MAPDYDNLTLMQKLEVFEHAMSNTTGQDLGRLLWLKSSNSEIWLDRRTNYTRSLAVMSIVGHVLGLGDRHPSNLMLHRRTGKLVHIDFGDCFEVAQQREKYPEKIPFRLTRMLVQAMEISGIEGNFRSTCESVMRVLRLHRDSVMALLEAFVHDPLINWRLLTPTDAAGTDDSQTKIKKERKSQEETKQENKKYVDDTVNNHEISGKLEKSVPSMVSNSSMPKEFAASLKAGTPLSVLVNNAEAQLKARRLANSKSNSKSNTKGENYSTAKLKYEKKDDDDDISSPDVVASSCARSIAESVHVNRANMEREMKKAVGPEGAEAPQERLNARAVIAINRVRAKLTGRDFDPKRKLDVATQVDRLIKQATSHENLCQCYIGWCPFW